MLRYSGSFKRCVWVVGETKHKKKKRLKSLLNCDALKLTNLEIKIFFFKLAQNGQVSRLVEKGALPES